MHYAFVLRTRTDVHFVAPFPPAEALLARAQADLVLLDDQLGVSRREHASVLLLNPSLAYRE